MQTAVFSSSSSRTVLILKECVDAFLWIGGIFLVGFIIVFHNFFVDAYQKKPLFSLEPATKTADVWVSRAAPDTLTKGATALYDKTLASIATVTAQAHTHTLDSYLENRIGGYKTPFSLLPPGKQLRIYRLGVQAPVKDVTYASTQQIQEGHFTTELEQGVVKYPFTTEPGLVGNTLIFGHSSVDYREGKKNPYGFIFSQLHELQIGDTIELIRNGKQYLYSVEETVIKNPKEVNSVVEQYQNNKYLTLMACYPRFSTAKRIMVIAKQLDPSQAPAHTVAQHESSAVN